MGSNLKLIDYFVICGLNVESGLEPDKLAGDNLDCSPLERPYKCHILSHLPDSIPGYPFDGEAVAMLCFPKGLSFTTNCNKPQQLHTFVITREDGTRSYGTALTFYEQIESQEICLAMQVLQDMHMAELSNSQSLTLKRQRERQSMRTILTDEFNVDVPSKYASLDRTTSSSSMSSYKNEYFVKQQQQQQKQSVYKRNQDILHCSKCICIISKLPLVDAFTKILTTLYELVKLNDTTQHQLNTTDAIKSTQLSLASYLFNLLYEVDYLPVGRSMRITTWKGPIVCQRPGPNDLPLCDYPLRELFDMFTVEEIITIFSCILLEHQVLIFSSDYGKLMLVAECLCSLLFPFIWQHTYVPILPASLLHFLDAPVPFIMGLQLALDEQEEIFESFSKPNSCAVDIDKRRVAHPEDVPSFPHLLNITQDIKQEMKKMRKDEKSSPSSSAESRDSGFIRDSYCGPDDCSGGDGGGGGGGGLNNTSSDWSLNAKMEMLQKNEALAKMTALARKTGIMSSMDEIKDSISEAAMSNVHKVGYGGRSTSRLDEHTRDLLFNSTIREIFLHYFFQIFGSYESFVIHHSSSDVQSWLSSRETTQNFDKTAFLSDQSDEALPFLASFIETQMFASFIDQKILSRLDFLAGNSVMRDRENFVVFENRLRSLKDDLQQSADQRPRRFYRTAAAKEAESSIERRAMRIDIIATCPRNVDVAIQQRQHFFPIFPSNCFDNCLLQGKKSRTAHEEWRTKYGLKARGDKTTFKQREEYMEEVKSKTSGNNNNNNNLSQQQQQQQPDTDLKAMVNNNWRIMERLLKEVKTKTKRMLVQKMGKEAVELGHGEVTRSGIEENTLIASLCDLLERIWSYGLIEKQDKSSLWFHITSYSETIIKNDLNNNNNNNNNNVNKNTTDNNNDNNNNSSGGNNSQMSSKDSTLPHQEPPTSSTSSSSSGDGNLTWPIRHHPHHHHSRKSSRGLEWPAFELLPISVVADFRNVLQMTEIKTSVGYSRAFVRLSLEKKLLSRHLKELFSNQDLLRKLYKRYSFLRCEDEREQFLYHLLSLNAVDYYCFTNSFTNTNIVYRILIFPRIKIGGGTTSANCWIRLSGQLGSTEDLPLPKYSLDVSIKHKNLGVLTTLRIGHDNSGLSAKWMVEHVLVRNEVTGHTYKFPCGRWLGKGVDDGALERLLVAEMVPPSVDSNELIERCRTPPRCRSPSASGRHIEPRISVNEIRERLCGSINNLVKHFCRTEKDRGSTTILLCGEGGLVSSMELVFQYGFRSARLFRNRFFIWDFLEKVMSCFESLLKNSDYVISNEIQTTMKSFCYVVSRINKAPEAVGKDERFQMFICFGLRDRLLPRYMKLVSRSPVTISMYEEQSFLRDPQKLQFVLDLLEPLKEFKVTLESSIIRGVEL